MKRKRKTILLALLIIVGIIAQPFNLIAQCASISINNNLVSNNGNGTCTYNLSYTISNIPSNLKSIEIISSCSNSTILDCNEIPNGATSVSGVSNNFTCPCNSLSNITFNFGTSAGNCGGGNSCTQVVSLTLLPLHWLSVTGSLNAQKQAVLNFKVSETNVANYSIEKSNDGKTFVTITTINSKGNGENEYLFKELTTLNGIKYYRIKQLNIDGGFSYSKIIKLSNFQKGTLTIYPNPVKKIITVSNATIGSKALLTDINGKQLQQININSTSFTLDMSNYNAGVYLLKSDGVTQKIIKE